MRRCSYEVLQLLRCRNFRSWSDLYVIFWAYSSMKANTLNRKNACQAEMQTMTTILLIFKDEVGLYSCQFNLCSMPECSLEQNQFVLWSQLCWYTVASQGRDWLKLCNDSSSTSGGQLLVSVLLWRRSPQRWLQSSTNLLKSGLINIKRGNVGSLIEADPCPHSPWVSEFFYFPHWAHIFCLF